MTLIHIVQFKFKPEVDKEAIRGVCDRMISLKDKCVYPTNKELYIKSASGGKDNSPEGLQHGFTHVFVVEFKSEEDRDFYVKHDEAHLAFVGSLSSLVDDVQVVDFTAGIY